MLPKLTLAAKSGKGKVTIKITDAGDPIKGAKVKVGKKTKKTNGKGVDDLQAEEGQVQGEGDQDRLRRRDRHRQGEVTPAASRGRRHSKLVPTSCRC